MTPKRLTLRKRRRRWFMFKGENDDVEMRKDNLRCVQLECSIQTWQLYLQSKIPKICGSSVHVVHSPSSCLFQFYPKFVHHSPSPCWPVDIKLNTNRTSKTDSLFLAWPIASQRHLVVLEQIVSWQTQKPMLPMRRVRPPQNAISQNTLKRPASMYYRSLCFQTPSGSHKLGTSSIAEQRMKPGLRLLSSTQIPEWR